MAPRQIYQDERALDKLLDNLLQTGEKDNSGVSDRSVYVSEGHLSASNISEKLAVANGLLQESKICSELPILEENDTNCKTVLDHALTAIVHLCRCCKANANLRSEAERSVLVANEEILNLQRLNEKKKEKVTRLETKIATMKKEADDSAKENKHIVSNLITECSELKTKCARSAYRVNHLSLEIKKHEREYTQLQQKVHSLMTNTKRLSIEPQIVAITTNNVSKSPCLSREKSHEREEKEFNELAGSAEDQCMNEVITENRSLRDLLRAVQEELDDLLVSNPSLLEDLKTPAKLSGKKPRIVEGAEDTTSKSPGPSSSEGMSSTGELTPSVAKVGESAAQSLKASLQRSTQNSDQKDMQDDDSPQQAHEQTAKNEETVDASDGESQTPSEQRRDLSSSKSDTNRRHNGLEENKASQVLDHEEKTKDFSNVTEPEVGTPVTGSPERNGTILNNLTPALTSEQMNLPFDMIRESLEHSLDQKFELLRLAFLQVTCRSPNAAKECL